MIFIADRIARADALQSDCRANVARQNLANLFAFVGVHLQQPTDALTPSSPRVQDGIPGLKLPGIDADKRQLADKRISHDLERQSRKRLLVVRLAKNLLP